MYPFLRWGRVALRRRRPSPDVFRESVLRFRVWPGDLDFFLHMNNGRYLTLMDSGRWDIMAGLGLIAHLRRRHWISVIGAASIQFLRPLKPFRRFELHSRLLGWDEKWFYVEQRFTRGGVTHATAVVKGLFRAPGKNVATADVLALIGHVGPSPAIPRWIVHALARPEAP